MAEYLKLFKTEADYEAESEKPIVSHIIDTVDVKIESSIHDYSKDYLTFVALESGTFKFANADYSLDGGKTWTKITTRANTSTVEEGKKILWRAVPTGETAGRFESTCRFNAEGNIMSIIYGDNFEDKTDLNNVKLRYLFSGVTNIVDAENLIMPATTLISEAYLEMFKNCSSLTKAPNLPATTLGAQCYREMFYKCTSLVKVQEELPATVLENMCYESMFHFCSSLEVAPNIKATTWNGIQDHMRYMFSSCSSLIKAPDVIECVDSGGFPSYQMCEMMFFGCKSLEIAPVIKIRDIGKTGGAIAQMFQGCTKLRYIKALFITTPVRRNSYRWVMNVGGNGVFVKSRDATWNVTASSSNEWIGVPTGWTIEYADE